MAAARECDVDFVGFAWVFEGREEPADHIQEFNLTQNQLSTNMYNRLISLTTGTAFQIVESVMGLRHGVCLICSTTPRRMRG